MPEAYWCPSRRRSKTQPNTRTNYFAVVGPHAAWPGETASTFDQVSDGLSNTVMVIEFDSLDISWMEPRDLSIQEATRLLRSRNPDLAGHRIEGDFFYEDDFYRHTLFCDGSVRFLYDGLPADIWVALLTADGGESVSDSVNHTMFGHRKKLKVGNCYRLVVFVFVVLLPLPWVWIHRSREASSE